MWEHSGFQWLPSISCAFFQPFVHDCIPLLSWCIFTTYPFPDNNCSFLVVVVLPRVYLGSWWRSVTPSVIHAELPRGLYGGVRFKNKSPKKDICTVRALCTLHGTAPRLA